MNFKKTIAALIPAFVLCFSSCQEKESNYTQPDEQGCVFATVPAPVNGDPETKGISINADNKAIFEWVKDVDNINVFSSKKGESMIYSVKEVSSDNPLLCNFLVEDFSLKAGSAYYAFYPSANTNDPENVSIDYTTQRQYALDDDSHLPSYSYMLAAPVEASESGAGFAFDHKSGWLIFKILAANDFTAEKIVVSTTTSDAFLTKGTMNVVDGTITPTKTTSQVVLYLGEPEEGLEIKGGIPTRAFMAINAVKTLDTVKAVLYGRNKAGQSVEIVKEINQSRTYAIGNFSTVTLQEEGAVVKPAKSGDVYYDTLADAIAVAEAGAVVEIVAAGTYSVPNLPKNIIIKGGVSGVVFDCTGSGSVASVPNGATFEDVTMNFGTTSYHGFQHAGTINMNGCILNGLLFSYGVMNFDGCTFNAPASDYSMWCYGTDATYTNCTFNGAGKFLNVYCEKNTEVYNITLEGCTFNSTKLNKAAVNVKETGDANMLMYNVVINDCTVATPDFFPAAAEFDASSALYVIDPLVQVDDRNLSATESEITVTLDGNVVYPVASSADFKIGDVEYETLAEALAAVKSGETVEIYAAGEYDVQTLSTPANTTVEAKVDGVVFNHTAAATSWVANGNDGRTVKNLTWNVGNANHQYFHGVDLVNCKVNGLLCTHSNNTYTDCEFYNADGYNLWEYGSGSTFINCKFTCAGKNDGEAGAGGAINAYNEGEQGLKKVVFNNCEFIALNASNKYSAVYIKPESSFDVEFISCSANDNFCTGAISGSKLWNVKNNNNINTKVTVDDQLVYANGGVQDTSAQ